MSTDRNAVMEKVADARRVIAKVRLRVTSKDVVELAQAVDDLAQAIAILAGKVEGGDDAAGGR